MSPKNASCGLSRTTIAALEALFAHLQPLLPECPPQPDRKWVKVAPGTYDTIDAEVPLFRIAPVLMATLKQRDSEPYQGLMSALDNEPRLLKVRHRDPHGSNAYGLIEKCVRSGTVLVGNRPTLLIDLGIIALDRLIQAVEATSISAKGRCCVFGLELTTTRVEIASGLSLVSLSVDEVNERQEPLGMPISEWQQMETLDHSTEIQCEMSSEVGDEDNALISERAKLGKQVRDQILRVRRSLRFFHDRRTIGFSGIHVTSSGTSDWEDSASPGFFGGTEFGVGSVPSLRRIYQMVDESISDATLRNALRRFVDGLGKMNPLDSLVDNVIALESFLCTVQNSEPKTELAYRFRLNGSSLLRYSGHGGKIETSYAQFKALYDARSAIVHGGDSKSVDKAIQCFGDIHKALQFARDVFREVAFMMFELGDRDRPYKAALGWERLVWGQKDEMYTQAANKAQSLLQPTLDRVVQLSK